MRIILSALSNPIDAGQALEFSRLLAQGGHRVELMPQIDTFTSFQQRAEWFNEILGEQVDYILDLSGGELTNGILPFIDYAAYAKSRALVVGYSDVTSLLNALAHKSKKPALLFQIGHHSNPAEVLESLEMQKPDFFSIRWKRLTEQTIDFANIDFVGGNMRCFLKLAGTPYMPDFRNKVIFLESYSATNLQVLSMLAQISQLRGFEKARGICFGQFTRLSETEDVPSFLSWAASVCQLELPIYYSDQIGHSSDSKALWIG